MRILIATDAWRPQLNGVVSTLERMTQAASTLARMAHIVHQIEGMQVSVAAAVEQQSATTREIARQMNEALTRTQSVADIAGRMTTGADATAAEAERTRGAADALLGMAGHLTTLVAGGDGTQRVAN